MAEISADNRVLADRGDPDPDRCRQHRRRVAGDGRSTGATIALGTAPCPVFAVRVAESATYVMRPGSALYRWAAQAAAFH